MQPLIEDLPLETSTASSVVSAAPGILAQLGVDNAPRGVPDGSDASKLSRAGIPSKVIGPGCIDQAHAAIEFVECVEVEQAFEFYRMPMLFVRLKKNCCRPCS